MKQTHLLWTCLPVPSGTYISSTPATVIVLYNKHSFSNVTHVEMPHVRFTLKQ